jgi:Tfp pilus assembly protein PilF
LPVNVPNRLAVVAAGLALAFGCNRPSVPEAKQQAERRWSEVRARVKLQLGRQQSENGLFEDAVATLTEAVALDPRSTEGYVLLARANLELSKPASSQQVLDAARQAGLEAADLHYLQGILFELRDQLALAVGEYEKARVLDPARVDYLLAHAECLVGANRAAEAMKLLDSSLHRFNENAAVAAMAGHVAELLGDPQRAMSYYAQALLDAGDHPVIAERYGLLLAGAGKCEQALAVLRPVANTKEIKDAGALRRALARCELALGDAMSAKAGLLEYAHAHTDDTAVHILLAQAAIETNDAQTAEWSLAVVERRSPNHPETALLRAAWHWRQNEHAAAAHILYDLLERDPSNGDAYRLLAEVLARQNQPAEAADCQRRALALDARY